MSKTHTNKKYKRHTRSQQGGIKVLLPNYYSHVMEREIKNIQGLQTILLNTRNIQVVSTSSLNSFVIRLHLDPSPSNILFRSDTLDTKKKFLSQQHKSLRSSQLDNEEDGLPIHEIIIKICIIGLPTQKLTLDCFSGADKDWISFDELVNEYSTQRYLYSSMMSISGNPFCPDAFGLVILDPPPVTNPRTPINIFRAVPNIQSILQSDPELNQVNEYLNRYSGMGLRIGVIIMESVPSSYIPIYRFSLKAQPGYDKNTYRKLCEGIASINILSIYRGKMFHLDAHPGNWLCNPKLSLLQQIKEIDFGRVYRIDNPTNTHRFINDMKQNIERYIKNNLPYDEAGKKDFTNRFYLLFGLNAEQLNRYFSEQNLDTKITNAKNLFGLEITNTIDFFRTNEYFSKPYISMGYEERKMNIKMIHRLILLSALVDSFYNCANYGATQAQISHIYNIILNITVSNPENIINYPITIDLDEYNLIRHDKAIILNATYRRVYDTIYNYSRENEFPHIRNYERFREIYRTRAQKAWIKIRYIGAGIAMCSMAAARGVSKCSRVVGNALSYVPGVSLASRLASSAYNKAGNLKRALKVKSSNALRKLMSKVSSAYPYEPIPPTPVTRAESPRALPSTHSSTKPITPLVYGGRDSTCKRRSKYHHRRTKKY